MEFTRTLSQPWPEDFPGVESSHEECTFDIRRGYVELKLTKKGQSIAGLYKTLVDVGDGWYRFEFWQVLSFFGAYFSQGTPADEFSPFTAMRVVETSINQPAPS